MPESEGEKRLRLFVAVPLWDEFREGAIDPYRGLRKRDWPLKWVRPENWHLTLKFLGDTPCSGLHPIAQSLRTRVSSYQAFSIEIGGLGGFPRLSKMRVFWVGVREGKEALIDLAEAAHQACAQAGYPGDKKKFQPHLTLARARTGPISVDVPKEVFAARWGIQRVDSVSLVQSTLGGGGAKYEVLEEFPLGRVTSAPP